MEHFSDEVWIDWIRGIDTTARKEMELHLEKGCPDCIALRENWSIVQALAQREKNYAPPENIVRLAKLLFDENLSVAKSPSAPAMLTFDTFMNPLLADVRSAAAAAARQMVYEAEGRPSTSASILPPNRNCSA